MNAPTPTPTPGTATDPATDPLAEYVADLTGALRGPAKAKARMIEEIRDGLADTTDAHVERGVPHGEAIGAAVREFGTVEELVPSCQRELTLAQARHTARAVALTAPFLIACWYLAGTPGHDQAGLIPRTARLLAVHLAGVSIAATLLAAVALAVTGTLARRLPTPPRLPLVVAWTGTTAGAAMAVTTLALATASALATNWPLLAFAGALAAASHAVVATSARACRRCARLPVSGTPGLG
ncbi:MULTISPECIES: permease prefix domain 1-containing protein [unclassified Streptomyces]|uniref:permease prefix domain 1-containing protein n=1 Tax=unclassified Streptomyces TaxID=2593676 RepID=UPI002966F8B0|nr:permease prefix domain 1-containing protein [Streptomyces sp. SJL17-1]